MTSYRSSKYHSRKTVVDGMVFDSRKEAARYRELKLLERAGLIRDLERQVKFVLIPEQREPDTIDYSKSKHGRRVRGRIIERECAYIADFRYFDCEADKVIIEDVKGLKSGTAYEVFKIKRKLMLYLYNIKVREI